MCLELAGREAENRLQPRHGARGEPPPRLREKESSLPG